MYENSEIVWKPLLNKKGLPMGFILDSAFAARCVAVSVSSQKLCELTEHLWELVKPEGRQLSYVPNDIFAMYEKSLLPQVIYNRFDGSGDWLETSDRLMRNVGTDQALIYSFHHTEPHDLRPNLWLLAMFDMWSRCAHAQLM